jgi:hypothetical protein
MAAYCRREAVWSLRRGHGLGTRRRGGGRNPRPVQSAGPSEDQAVNPSSRARSLNLRRLEDGFIVYQWLVSDLLQIIFELPSNWVRLVQIY